MSALGNLTRSARNLANGQRGGSPVPLAARGGRTMPLGLGGQGDMTEQLGLMAANGTAYSVINLLASDVGAQTNAWHLYRADTTSSRGRVTQPDMSREVLNHAALDLWMQPNAWFDNMLFTWAAQQHMELTGKTYWVVTPSPGGPLDMWIVRPDRMTPVPSPNNFLLGWIYSGPDGQQIALPADEVIWVRTPDPMDPYNGLGPAEPLAVNIESGRAISDWNRNFFRNNAQPGGFVQFPDGVRLSDEQFTEITTRWAEQHQGVSRAHRVAFLEMGAKWLPAGYSMSDMQFVELRQDARDSIYEGWGVGGGMLGVVEDVNRANMEGTEYNYAKRKLNTRLALLRGALNGQLLPRFGSTGEGVVFDYDNPVPKDWQADAQTLGSQASAVLDFVAAGYKPNGPGGVLETVGVPEMEYVGPPTLPQLGQAAAAAPSAPPTAEQRKPITARSRRMDRPMFQMALPGKDN